MAGIEPVTGATGGRELYLAGQLDGKRPGQFQIVTLAFSGNKVGDRLKILDRETIDIAGGHRATVTIDRIDHRLQRHLPGGGAHPGQPGMTGRQDQEQKENGDADGFEHEGKFP